MSVSANRLESVDVARGLAALSVAIYHQHFGSALARFTGRGEFLAVDWSGAHVAVPLFFVISGFCIHLGGLARGHEPDFARTFFVQRFFRIYPPWLSAVVLSALVATARGMPPTGLELASHLTLTNAFFADYRLNPVLWSVSVEGCLYVLYPLWFAFRRRYGLAVGFALGLAVSAASNTMTALIVPEPDGTTIWFFLNVWCGWLAGAAFAEWLRAPGVPLLRRPSWWLAGLVAALAFGAALQFGVFHGPLGYARLPLAIMLCTWLLALLIAGGEVLAARPATLAAGAWRGLAAVGLFSYSLYLLHAPLQATLFQLLPHVGGAAKHLLFVGWFGFVLAASRLHYRRVEAPSIHWGRRVIARLRASAAGAQPATSV